MDEAVCIRRCAAMSQRPVPCTNQQYTTNFTAVPRALPLSGWMHYQDGVAHVSNFLDFEVESDVTASSASLPNLRSASASHAETMSGRSRSHGIPRRTSLRGVAGETALFRSPSMSSTRSTSTTISPPADASFYGRYHDVRLHLSPSTPQVYPGSTLSCAIYLSHAQHEASPRVLSAKVTMHSEASRRKRNYFYDTSHPSAASQSISSAAGISVSYPHRSLPSRTQLLGNTRCGPRNAKYVYAATPLLPAENMRPVQSLTMADVSDSAVEPVQRAIRFEAVVPEETPESVSFMEDIKPDCRVDIRLRLRARIRLHIARAGAVTTKEHTVTLIVDNVVKVLPRCSPLSSYMFNDLVFADDGVSMITDSTPSPQSSSGSLGRVSSARSTRSTAKRMSDTTLLAEKSHGSIKLESESFAKPVRIGNQLQVTVTVRIPSAARKTIRVQAALDQLVRYGAKRPRARRSLVAEEELELNDRGEARFLLGFEPTRANAFYATTTRSGPLSITHCVVANVYASYNKSMSVSHGITLLPGAPTPHAYPSQNADTLPRWCTSAFRKLHRPVVQAEETDAESAFHNCGSDCADHDDDDISVSSNGPEADKEEEEEEHCVICLEPLSARPVTRLPVCGHKGHAECMQQWLERRPVCPYCVAPMPGIYGSLERDAPVACCDEHVYYAWSLRRAYC